MPSKSLALPPSGFYLPGNTWCWEGRLTLKGRNKTGSDICTLCSNVERKKSAKDIIILQRTKAKRNVV